MDKSTICKQFAADHAERMVVLEQARECSRLTDPTILPFTDQRPKTDPNGRVLPQNYQSLGSEGVVNIEGKLLTSLFPVGIPWIKSELDPKFLNDPSIPDISKEAILHDLMVQDLITLSALETAGLGVGQGQTNRFRPHKRKVLGRLIVTGDTLEHLDDKYRLRSFRNDKYVTRRDSRGDVLYHITEEEIDPLSLTDEQIATADLKNNDLKAMRVAQRMKPLYTNIEWQPWTKTWVIEQEINNHVINRSEETVSPYFSTTFKLVEGEHYGRGLVYLHMGDLFSFDEGSLRFLNFMELCSKVLTVVDTGSQIRDRDFLKPSGSIIKGRVVGGVVQDAAIFKADKLADFKVCAEVMQQIAMRLAKVFLSASNSVRDSERTTAFEVARATIAELEGALGGVYAPIEDAQQTRLIDRTVWQLRRDKQLPTLDEKLKSKIKVNTLTGLAALADLRRAEDLKSLVVDAQTLGDAGISTVNIPVALRAIARYRRINEPGLIKTDEQITQERQDALKLATQAEAANKAIDVGGNVAQAQLTPG